MNLPVHRIVVPVDFSDRSLDAVDVAKGLLAEGGQLRVVHVLAPIVATEPGVIWGTVDETSRHEHAEEALATALAERGHGDIPAEVAMATSGNAAWEVVKLAEKHDAELIVLPSHGRSGLSRLAIGSVAERVVRYAHCPVLVLRQ